MFLLHHSSSLSLKPLPFPSAAIQRFEVGSGTVTCTGFKSSHVRPPVLPLLSCRCQLILDIYPTHDSKLLVCFLPFLVDCPPPNPKAFLGNSSFRSSRVSCFLPIIKTLQSAISRYSAQNLCCWSSLCFRWNVAYMPGGKLKQWSALVGQISYFPSIPLPRSRGSHAIWFHKGKLVISN